METETFLMIAIRLGYLPKDAVDPTLDLIAGIGKILGVFGDGAAENVALRAVGQYSRVRCAFQRTITDHSRSGASDNSDNSTHPRSWSFSSRPTSKRFFSSVGLSA